MSTGLRHRDRFGGNPQTTRDYGFVDRDVVAGVRYYYKLVALNFSGDTGTHGPVAVTLEEAPKTASWGMIKVLLKRLF